MKILSIGNSFSQDAQRYLYRIAEANGKNLKNMNLYIGGCSLKRHYLNILEDNKAYLLEYKGEGLGLYVSVKDVLMSDDWDYVTLQQVSRSSYDTDTYTPYIETLKEYVHKYCPKAKILLHQTWAYPDFSTQKVGFNTTEEMFAAVKKAYDEVYENIGADGMIRSGEAMIKAYRELPENTYRDSLHAGLGFARYMVALVWFKAIYGDVEDFKHIESFDEEITGKEKELAYKIAFGK